MTPHGTRKALMKRIINDVRQRLFSHSKGKIMAKTWDVHGKRKLRNANDEGDSTTSTGWTRPNIEGDALCYGFEQLRTPSLPLQSRHRLLEQNVW